MRTQSMFLIGVILCLALMTGHQTGAYCPEPVVDHGHVETSQGNEHTSMAVVRCEEGYTWIGHALSVCDSSGIWDPPLNKCYAKCKWPRIANSVDTPLADLLEHGYEHQVMCEERFTIPHDGVIRCDEGRWVWTDESHQDITCTAHCPEPEVGHGEVDTDKGNKVHSIATIMCNDGYMCDGSCKVMCSPDGIWTPQLPTCAAQCQEPSVPNFTPWPAACAYKHNALFVMTCDAGYTVPHHGLLRCDDGAWTWALGQDSIQDIECKPMRCRDPFIPHRLDVPGPGPAVGLHRLDVQGSGPAVHGDVVKVVCEKGYYIEHGGFIRCYRGDWVWDDSVYTYSELIQCKREKDACPQSTMASDEPHRQISHETQASSFKNKFNYGLHLMAGFAFLYLRYTGQNPTFPKWLLYLLTTQVIIFYCNQTPHLWLPWGI